MDNYSISQKNMKYFNILVYKGEKRKWKTYWNMKI